MNKSCKQVAASNVELFEILYAMHLSKDPFFYSIEFTENLLIAIAANIALTKKINEEIDNNIKFYTTNN